MGFDNMKDQASNFANEHDEQIDQGIERGGDMVDERTGGQHAEQVDQAQERLQGLSGDEGGQA